MASANTESQVHPWLAFPNPLTLLPGLHAQPDPSKAAISNATMSLWIPPSPLTGMLSSLNQSPTHPSRPNLNTFFFPFGHGQCPVTSAWRPCISCIFGVSQGEC